MRQLLHVSASPRGELSHSRRAGRAFVEALSQSGGVTSVVRDLVESPLPYPGRTFAEASLMPSDARKPADRMALALSDILIAELEAADILLIDTPMHNFTLPATLKAWVDHIVRPGRTFLPSPQGKVGVLTDRPVFLIVACGGSFGEEASSQPDFLTPYLRHVLATIGLASVETLRIENLRRGDAAVDAAERMVAAWTASRVTGSRVFPTWIEAR